ncbi:MAG: hypothetical protein AAF085_08585, partial [Planctomycetota bacterium]
DQPILGVITSGGRLYETDALFGQPGVIWPTDDDPVYIAGRGLERDNPETFDNLRIDGQSLYLGLGLVAGGYLDQVRVLVHSEQQENLSD